jgi:hypothetical protein
MSPKTLVVRRGLDAAYYFYLSIFAHEENELQLLVDRRSGERRSASPSSAIERRGVARRHDGAVTDQDIDLLRVIEG